MDQEREKDQGNKKEDYMVPVESLPVAFDYQQVVVGDLGGLELADIIDAPGLQSMMDDFYAFTGLPMSIIDLQGRVLVGIGWQEICTRFHRVHPETRQHCLESDTELTRGVTPGTFRLYKCKNNLWDVVTPILVGEEHLGNLFMGQFFFTDDNLDRAFFLQQAQKYGFDPEEYMAALEKVPRWPRETIEAVMSFFTKFAHNLYLLGYSNICLTRLLGERDRLLQTLREREEDLSTTLHSIGDGVIVTDLEGRVTRLNPAAEKLTGWSQEEARGRPVEEIFVIKYYRTGEVIQVPVYRVLAAGLQVDLANDTVLVARDGREHHIADSAAPIRDYTGRVTGAIMVFSDITQAYRAREELKHSEEEKSLILDSISETCVLYDLEKRIVWTNKRADELAGVAPGELRGEYCYRAWFGLESPCEGCPMDKVIEEGVFNEGEVVLPSGGVTMLVKGYPYKDERGEITGFIELGLDITEKKKVAQELEIKNHQMERLNYQLNLEINKAQRIHERILPKDIPRLEGLSLATHYQPAQNLGGDFHDFIQVGNKLVLYLSDVMGHGLDGAMLSIFVKEAIDSYLSLKPGDIQPKKILEHLDRRYRAQRYPEEYLVCIFLGILDLDTRELVCTGAGFQTPALVRLGDGKTREITRSTLPLSRVIPPSLVDFKEESLVLTPGTTILFSTDGLPEHMVGDQQYKEIMEKVFYDNSYLPPGFIVRAINEDFREFNQGSLQGEDDITYGVLQVDPEKKKEAHLVLKSNPGELEILHREVSGLLNGLSVGHPFILGLHELVVNAMEHGNRLDPEREVKVDIKITGNCYQATVRDQGEGFDWRGKVDRCLELDSLMDRGRGIIMTNLLCDRLFYNQAGNQVWLFMEGDDL